MEAINRQALRVLKPFGNKDVTHVVTTTVGPSRNTSSSTKSSTIRERTLLLRPHPFRRSSSQGPGAGGSLLRAISTRVAAFMKDLDEELWKLGIYAKDRA